MKGPCCAICKVGSINCDGNGWNPFKSLLTCFWITSRASSTTAAPRYVSEWWRRSTATSKPFSAGAVDGFDRSEAYLGAAVVEDAVEVIQKHVSKFLKGFQPLPSQLIDPTLQIAQHGPFIAVGPQPLQAFLQKVGFHHPSIEGEQIV